MTVSLLLLLYAFVRCCLAFRFRPSQVPPFAKFLPTTTNTITGSRYASNRALLMGVDIGPRKALFFDIVESGLQDKFETSDIARVYRFCEYAKLEIPGPKPLGDMHDPCEEFIEGLTAKAWWNSQDFSWANHLEIQAPIIRCELESVLQQQEVFKGDSRYQQLMGSGWTAFRLQRLGEWNKQNMALFPRTTEIVQGLDIPLAVRGVMFAKQAPGSGVQPHSDGRNFILTAHLGLKVPEEGCWISVAGVKKSWKRDGLIVFDTSFTHETSNESNQDRYVLIIDFWHPELTHPEREALKFIYDCRNKFDSGKARQIDCGYVRDGKPTDVEAYKRSQQTFGQALAGLFGNGGFVKYN